jgi:hypothetical protein
VKDSRRFAALAVVFSTLAVSPSASGHDPLEATATARIEVDSLVLSITLGSRRAFRACGRTPFDKCARDLYVVSSAGGVLTPRSSRAALREDGDLELTVSYPRPRVGLLRLTAAHLQRNRDEMAGATVTVLAGDRFLRREILAADRASIEVQLASGDR